MNEKKTINIDLKQYSMIIILVVVYLLFAVITKGMNMTPASVNNLVMQNSYVVILAVGMLLCCLTGNVDLSVGSTVAVAGAAAGIAIVDMGMPSPVAMIFGLLVGLGFGLFNGFFIAYVGIPPFITTLATMLMGRGLTYTVLAAQTKGPLPGSYTFLGSGFLPSIKIAGNIDLICCLVAAVVTALLILSELNGITTRKKYNFPAYPVWQLAVKDAVIIVIVWFFMLKLGANRGLPIVLIVMAALVGLYHYITTMTVAGRQVYAMGGNAKAAQLSGIDTKKVFFWVYTNMGVLAGLAGVVLSSRNASATPKAGDAFEMDAIASCYIGGAACAGGIGTIIGAVVGAFIMGTLNIGMTLMGLGTDAQKIVKGAVLLGAVTFDLVSKRKK
ncbi:MAG: sugar ABC transporter permease [Oscillospiraceae bacterium]|nr:sugar ABC transporter permease [Oscillospiraceae bacterium]